MAYDTIEINYESQGLRDRYSLQFKKDDSGSNGSFSCNVGFCKLTGEVTGLAPDFLDDIVDELDDREFFTNPQVHEQPYILDGTLLRRLQVKASGDGREFNQNLEIRNNGHTPYDQTIGKLEHYLGRYLSGTPVADFIESYKRK